MPYQIYTDGSASPNPGPTGAGALLVHTDDPDTTLWAISEFLGPGTNNLGELTAIYRALQRLTELNIQEAEVFSDSELAVDLLNKTKTTKKAHLLPLIQKIQDLIHAHDMQITFHWVKAHSGHPLNEQADRLAASATAPRLAAPLPPAPPSKEKTLYLNCPFSEKDEAKALGAKWDKDKKKWKVQDTHENRDTFAKWLATSPS